MTEKTIVLTGDRPTGRLHLGHLAGSIKKRVELQEQSEKNFYLIADLQALTDNAENPEKVKESVVEVALDNLASGLDPKKTTFLIQSKIPEISELTILFLNLVTLARLKRNPTVKDEMKHKGYEENVPAGFLTYPVSQAADILFCKANLIPVGEDQLPVIEQANEIVDKFNSLYGQTFQKIKTVTSETPRLMGIDGRNKASKSLNNAIFLSDPTDIVEKKVMAMFTDPKHLRAEDPGTIEGNVVFQYLDAFDPEKSELEKIKKDYEQGGLGDVIIKKHLIEVLEKVLEPIRKKRDELSKDKSAIMKILKDGTGRAREEAAETMSEVRAAMKINYF